MRNGGGWFEARPSGQIRKECGLQHILHAPTICATGALARACAGTVFNYAALPEEGERMCAPEANCGFFARARCAEVDL